MIDVSSLTWTASPYTRGPVAKYTLDYSVDTSFKFSLSGAFGTVPVQPKWIVINNYNSDQNITFTFGAIDYPVNPFQRLTVPVPPNATQCVITSDAALTLKVIFSVENLNIADGVNFKAIQASGLSENVWPKNSLTGSTSLDQFSMGQIWDYFIGVSVAQTLPDCTLLTNGSQIEFWNDNLSTAGANLTINTFNVSQFISERDTVVNNLGSPTPFSVNTIMLPPGGRCRLLTDTTRWYVMEHNYVYQNNGNQGAGFGIQHGFSCLIPAQPKLPDRWRAYLKCTIANVGYTPGMIIPFEGFYANFASNGVSLTLDTTNGSMVFRVGLNMTIPNFTTGVATTITPADWELWLEMWYAMPFYVPNPNFYSN